jgi:hypothetical protein
MNILPLLSGSLEGKVMALFENRTVSISGGRIIDQVSPFGTKAYLLLDNKDEKTTAPTTNLLIDPGFENLIAPGLPSACYARPGGDRGATFFLDSRESAEGIHSLRLTTPVENKGAAIRFFPVTVKAGKSYAISLWAKADPEQRFTTMPAGSSKPQYAEIQLGIFNKARFEPDDKWREYITFVRIPFDTTSTVRTNLILKMTGQGIGWFDMIKVIEEK